MIEKNKKENEEKRAEKDTGRTKAESTFEETDATSGAGGVAKIEMEKPLKNKDKVELEAPTLSKKRKIFFVQKQQTRPSERDQETGENNEIQIESLTQLLRLTVAPKGGGKR